MTKENISLTQLLMLVINFELGSAIVVGVGQDLGNDVWIGLLISSVWGAAFVWFCYLFVTRLEGKDLFGVIEYCVGRKPAIVIALLYCTYFLYIAARVVRDFCELLSSLILPNTPMEVISLTLCLVIGYIIYLGVEVLARTNEIFSPYLLFFILLLTIFLVASGNVDVKQLAPVLADGPKPLVKAIFPELITFPYGEMITFTVIFPLVTKKSHILRVSLWGVAISTSILLLAAMLTVTSIGVDAMQRSNFPLLTVARIISIGGFIERIEAFVVFITMLGILVKSSVFLFCALKGMEFSFKLPFRYFAIPGAMTVSVFSVLVSVDFADHIQEGIKMAPKFMHVPFQLVIPGIMFVLLLVKQKLQKKKEDGKSDETI